jgi:hydroxymethylglutaryl-CoA reductase
MNGVDALLATGNDFRAVEAGFMPMLQNQVSTPASHAKIENGVFILARDPVSLGTVGGLTTLHPLVKLSLEMLKILQPKN